MELVIKNGTIITAADTYQADIAARDGKIAFIGDDSGIVSGQAIDASGKLILPGAIDAHVHLQTPVLNTVSADNYESGTRAAACGGVTTVFDFAVQHKGEGLLEDAKKKIAEFEPQACIDFSFHTVITDIEMVNEKEIIKSREFGIPSFKLYMVYEGLMVDDGILADVLKMSRETGTLVAVHAENASIIDRRIKELGDSGKKTPWHHYESRPEFVEAEAVKRAIHLAKSMKSPLYIVHLACEEGLNELRKARCDGYKVYAETCPQYLNFTNEVYKQDDAVKFVCSPPIKGEESRNALWEGLVHGDITTIATDHCPFQSYEKDLGKDDFTKIPNGCMGVEIMYPYMLGQANEGRISFNKAIELCSTNPAKIFGCAPKKGTIAVGSDADIVIYDPEKEAVISKDMMHSNVDHTIWEGTRIKGYPVMTFSRGRLIYQDGQFTGEPGWGQFVCCHIN